MFFLGTHMPNWLSQSAVPLFVSCRRLRKRKALPRAASPWGLDSGGFTELSMYGRWRTTEEEYVRNVRRYAKEIGNLSWASPQDWMCEPWILAKTGRTVQEHQRSTIANFISLRGMAPEIKFIPVIQGFSRTEYLDCVKMYRSNGIDLSSFDTVGIGSICRRQGTGEALAIIKSVRECGIDLHGFGFKTAGLKSAYPLLKSSDSMAWSFAARARKVRLPGCPHGNCSNCYKYAMEWRSGLLLDLQAKWGAGIMKGKGDVVGG